MKKTAFFEIHEELGAKIVDFAGFQMPVQYGGVLEEHKRVRESVGVFDVSHMGEVEVRGKDALAFVQKITTNDASKLESGRVQYSAMCYDDGGIVDDLLVYRFVDYFMLVINASNIVKDFDWMKSHLSGDVQLIDRSDETSLLAVQGPNSLATLQKLTFSDLSTLPYYHFVQGQLAGIEMIISRTGYTGEPGFELYFPSDVVSGKKAWTKIMEAGAEFSIGPVGLGARDTLRLEMGFCLYGNDIDRSTNPLEAGLGWITKLGKGEFIGRNAILKSKENGLTRKLVGFVLNEKAFPRHGYPLQFEGAQVGNVTSGMFSPILEKSLGMGYVRSEFAKPETQIQVLIRDRALSAVTTAVPFIKK